MLISTKLSRREQQIIYFRTPDTIFTIIGMQLNYFKLNIYYTENKDNK